MISAVVLAKNEAQNIEECIRSLQWCGEILVIDDYSTDKTAEIAKKLGARVLKRRLENNFAAQRNFGLMKTRGEWVLFVDADERVSKDLAAEIQDAAKTQDFSGFFLKRQDIFLGRKLNHGETAGIRLLRFGRKGAGKWRRPVHEYWDIKGKVGTLKNPLLHYPHPTLASFLTKINTYSTLHAMVHYREGKKSSLLKIIFYPFAKFIKNWLLQAGFLDGTAGFVHAAYMSFHSFLAWSKLWLIQQERN